MIALALTRNADAADLSGLPHSRGIRNGKRPRGRRSESSDLSHPAALGIDRHFIASKVQSDREAAAYAFHR